MGVPFYQFDAFTDRPLAGNPAAVLLLPAWPADEVLRAIAAENNLSETAFLVALGSGAWHLRWFTPTVEVDLCGHATLAAAAALVHRGETREGLRFRTASGELGVEVEVEALTLDFPQVPVTGRLEDPELAEILGHPDELWSVREVHRGRYALAILRDEGAVRAFQVDLRALARLRTNVIVAAVGGSADVVSRFFAPASGVDEDPVTGSAHCTLAPFFAERLGRNPLFCRQLSARGGSMIAEVRGGRVRLSGAAVLVIEGHMFVPQ